MNKNEVLIIYSTCTVECMYLANYVRALGFKIRTPLNTYNSELGGTEITQEDISGIKLLINTGVDLSHLDLTGIIVENFTYQETGSATIFPFTALVGVGSGTVGQYVLKRLEVVLGAKFTDDVYEEVKTAYEITKNPVLTYKLRDASLTHTVTQKAFGGSISDFQDQLSAIKAAIGARSAIGVGDKTIADIRGSDVVSDVDNILLMMTVCKNYDGVVSDTKSKVILSMADKELVRKIYLNPSPLGGVNPTIFNNGHSLMLDKVV